MFESVAESEHFDTCLHKVQESYHFATTARNRSPTLDICTCTDKLGEKIAQQEVENCEENPEHEKGHRTRVEFPPTPLYRVVPAEGRILRVSCLIHFTNRSRHIPAPLEGQDADQSINAWPNNRMNPCQRHPYISITVYECDVKKYMVVLLLLILFF